jgi:hypothetical protein
MASPAASRGTSAVVLGVALAGAIIANCTTATVASSATAGTAPLVWKAPQVGTDTTAVMADGNLLLDEGTKKVTPNLSPTLPSFSLPNPILYLGIPCALVKLME